MRTLKRILVYLLITAFVFTDLKLAYADENTVYISSEKELRDISKYASKENETLGKVYILSKDIDLSGTEFEPAAVFAGTFDGAGHSIRGLKIGSLGRDAGIFRFVSEKGRVLNLSVEADIETGGSMDTVGIIAGTNRGFISGCEVRGSIRAAKKAGGIAGVNDKSGIINACVNRADINATKQTGGIAGYNAGQIIYCGNEGEINTKGESITSDEDQVSKQGELSLGILKEDPYKLEAMGGIAGISTGNIKLCTNNALIGSEHAGYQIGGICGLHKGVIEGCINNASVYGRKDIGGIAGEQEPYIEIEYERDTLERLSKELDTMDRLLTELYNTAESSGDSLEADSDSVHGSLEGLRAELDTQKEHYKDRADKAGGELDRKYKSIDDAGEDIENAYDSIGDGIDGITGRPDTDAYIRDTGNDEGAENAPEEELLEKISGISQGISRDFQDRKAAAEDTLNGIDDMRDGMSDLISAADELGDYINSERKSLHSDIKASDDKLSDRNSQLKADIENTRNDVKEARQEIGARLDNIEGELRVFKNTVQDGADNFRDKLEDGSFYKDVSDRAERAYLASETTDSINNAEVYADIDGGGIVGRIGIEPANTIDIRLGEKPEIQKEGELSANAAVNVYSAVKGCKNSSDIYVKNDYAGGVIGRADYGLIQACENYGNIYVKEGSFAGGIAGLCENVIRNCYSLGDASAADYVGGIAGRAYGIYDNTAIASAFSKDAGRSGVIAGEITDKGEASGNVYADEDQGAIGGVSYTAEASPVSYEDIVKREGTPERFKKLHVSFVEGDRIIKNIDVEYGGRVYDSDIPKLSAYSGSYAVWENKPLSNIRRNIVVHAEYSERTGSISSVEKEDKRPVMLAGSSFSPNALLTVRKKEVETKDIPDGYKLINAYSYIIDSDGADSAPRLEIRALADGADTAAIKGDYGYIIVKSERTGSYLKLYTAESSGEILLLKKNADFRIYMAAAAVIALCIAVMIYRKKKRGKRIKPERNEQR